MFQTYPTLAFFFLTSYLWAKVLPAIDAVDRLRPEELKAVRQSVLHFRSMRRECPRAGNFQEFRANLHVHSAFSHDSQGKIDEIVKAAKAAGTQILMFNEHPAPTFDFVDDGHQGVQDGILLIPGAEMKGLLVFPKQSVKGLDSGPVQDFADMVRNREGLTFLSHLEERMDWELNGLSGVEIYNTHADAKEEKKLFIQLRNPFWLLKTAELTRMFPQETFSALQHYPAAYLKRWDQLCEKSPHTGVSANDAHQNIGLKIQMVTANQIRIEDALGKTLLEVDASLITTLLPSLKTGKPAEIIFQMQLDPYECSLKHVATHLLMKDFSVGSVWEALQAGRAFVAFDWIADSTTFNVHLDADGTRLEMGSESTHRAKTRLVGQAPLPAHWKLIRNGTVVSDCHGTNASFPIDQPGRYRTELWLTVANEEQIWIITNPFYVNP